MSRALAAALLALALPATAQLSAPGARGKKPFGLLLLGEGGDPAWQQTVDDVKRLAGGRYPVEFAAGQAEGDSEQKAIDALQAQGVEKIVAVPLFLSSYSDLMDENRYLFGIREKAARNVVGNLQDGMAVPRLSSRVPLILTRALDDQDAMADVVVARARELGHGADPAQEVLVLIGAAPQDKDAAREWVSSVSALAEKARQRGGYAKAQAMAVREEQTPEQRQKSEDEIRKALRGLRQYGTLLVIPLELTPDYLVTRLNDVLDGMFVRFDGKTLLPDARLDAWVIQTAAAAADLPDMRQFKSARAGVGSLPSPAPPKLSAPPPIYTSPAPKENH